MKQISPFATQRSPAVCSLIGVLLAAVMGSVGGRAESAERPNIVMILADDLGYGDLACYGHPQIATPNLDRLAADGVRFTAHYANGAECTPTRAAFLTGRYQQRIGGLECAIGTGNVGRYDDAIRLRESNDLGLPAELPTIGAMVRNAGYATALFGKWHLGYEPKFAPQFHGFEQTYYCIGGGMDYFHYLDRVAGYNLFRDGRPINDEGYFTDLITERAIGFVADQTADKPFFLYLPYTCPHSPFQGPEDNQPHPLPLDSPRWKQNDAPPEVYQAMIEHMDRRIGDVLDSLEKHDFADNTVVIFAGDNGGTKSARNAPLSGTKGSTQEGGIRVPGMIRYPGVIDSGTVSDQPSMTFDFTRSIAELAGVEASTRESLEGIDIVAHVAEQASTQSRTLYWRKPRGDKIWKAVRQGDMKWWALADGGKQSEHLFNLSNDIDESNDLMDEQPKVAARLRRLYRQWEEKTRKHRRGRPESN